jgi:hypothetical protein
MSQNDRLLAYMMEGNQVTPMDAWNLLGIYRLSARIYDLQREGVSILREMKEVKNRFGETCRVACYRINMG